MGQDQALTAEDDSSASMAPTEICVPCINNIRIRSVTGRREVNIENNSHFDTSYAVASVNRFFYQYENLNGFVNWRIVNDFTGQSATLLRQNRILNHRYVSRDNAVLYRFYPYIQTPIEEVSQQTWVNKSYRRLIGHAVDDENNTISSIFAYFCQFYLDRYERYANYDNWRSNSNIDDMLEAIVDFLYEDKSRLDILDFARKQTVVDRFNSGRSLQNAGEFDNQWDKVTHFLCGVKYSSTDSAFVADIVAYGKETRDSFNRLLRRIVDIIPGVNTLQQHHIGFDWKDYAWTLAGAYFYKFVVRNPTRTQGINIIHAFANGDLSISNVFSADSVPQLSMWEGGDPLYPFLVWTEINNMRATIESVY